ncbi:STAS/SEC14 domain-containing protein [Sorangium sp. So ce1000]|uniref:STAS/SEC14 domain-containing protein n=1 Tax=Sorangium sp. So ce1000 TaxID=3133325 RepID=UPI003F63A818
MYQLKIDLINALIEVTLQGVVRAEEAQAYAVAYKKALGTLYGRRIRVLVDFRRFSIASEEATELLRDIGTTSAAMGVVRTAELVQSDLAALQAGRIAREAGIAELVRVFKDEGAARGWLLGDRAAPG